MEEEREESMRGFFFEIVKMFLLALVIIVPIRTFLFQPFIVRGASMEPSFYEKEYLIINEFGYKDHSYFDGNIHIASSKDLYRGDVVVFRAPLQKKDYYIKRVIGEPGDTVIVDNGIVKIKNAENPNGYTLDESGYLKDDQKTNGSLETTLKDGQFFVLGDNRNASSDSRSFGPIDRTTIVGKTLLRAFPFGKIEIF